MSDEDRITIRVSDDGLKAWARLDEGPAVGLDELERLLAACGVREGLDLEAIANFAESLCSENAQPREICLARGQAATPCVPPRLLLSEPEGLVPGTLREDGSFDFRLRRQILPVEKGDLLGRIQPAVEGKPGWTVAGESLEPEVCGELATRFGDGVIAHEDGRVVAARRGARFVGADGLIDVVELHVHAGNVDLSSGHLETRGSLEVARDVTAGMNVRAGKDLTIKGSLDGGSAEAGGSIEIGGGLIGRDEGCVRAGADLRVRHTLGAQLFARGRISVARSVSASRLHAREIEVEGRALGNSLEAETFVRVKDAGSPAGGPCALRVAIPLDPENFDPRLRAAAVGGPIPARKRGKRANRSEASSSGQSPSRKGGTLSKQFRSDPQTDLDVRLDWRRRQRLLQQVARVEIQGTAHAGCRIDFGTKALVLETTATHQIYRLDLENDEIVLVDDRVKK